jgi:NADPH:quinone reductase-like Zn-dependent oxidoreductase
MKAIVVEHLGEPGSLKELPRPAPAAGEILVRITAAGVNPIDWKSRNRGDLHLPAVLGRDFSGVVSAVGEQVTKYREGERIFGVARAHGSYAQYTVVGEHDRAGPVAKIPDRVGDADAAALPTAGLTALAALESLGVRAGTTLLVLGATGGVGSFAVQMARDRKAHVIGTAKTTQESAARSLGVDEFVPYDAGDVVEAVKAAHPDGVDAVLDLVDDENAIKAMADLIHAGGSIVSTVGAAGESWFAQRKIAAENLYSMDSPQWSHAGLRTLAELVEQQRLQVNIAAEYALADAIAALELSERGGANGKIVITVA